MHCTHEVLEEVILQMSQFAGQAEQLPLLSKYPDRHLLQLDELSQVRQAEPHILHFPNERAYPVLQVMHALVEQIAHSVP